MNLSGRVALITGATSGIGFHTAIGLARAGATVYVTGRNVAAGAAAQARIRSIAQHGRAYFIAADAATVGSNEELAERLASHSDHLDILVNNVGGTYNDRCVTQDGYEATLAMNFVGPCVLTRSLLPMLERAGAARVVNLASAAIAMFKGDPFGDLQSEERFLGSEAYARAKLLNVLWTFALARRVKSSGIVANALHPGLVWTAMTQSMAPRSMPLVFRFAWPFVRWLQRRGSPENGARTPVYLASAPEAGAVTGTYFESNGKPAKVPRIATDVAMQERAWALAGELARNAPTVKSQGEMIT